MKKRKILDGTMALLMIFLSSSGLNTGNAEMMLHEYGGIILFVCFFLHMIWNRKWFTSIFEKDCNLRKRISIIVDLLLMIMMALVIVSSLSISRIVFSFLHLPGTFMARKLHLFATAWLISLSAFHLGFHHNHSKVNILWFAFTFAGVAAFVMERYWERMLLLSDFAYVPDIPGVMLYVFGFLIFISFGLLGSLTSKMIVYRNRR